MLNPVLSLAFTTPGDAYQASLQHICLCRNEDILLPDPQTETVTEDSFDLMDGFELLLDETEESFLTGFNRFNGAEPMYGRLEITGNPLRNT
jgi:hypothetical protein